MTSLLKTIFSVPVLATVMIGLTLATIFVTVDSISKSTNIEEMSIEHINDVGVKKIDQRSIQSIPAIKLAPSIELPSLPDADGVIVPSKDDEETQNIEIIKSGSDGPITYIEFPPLFFNARVAYAGELRSAPRCQMPLNRRTQTCLDNM